jgi:hypothetical protein
MTSPEPNAAKRLRDLIGPGLVCAFLAACVGMDETGQFIMFVFGITWGRMIR